MDIENGMHPLSGSVRKRHTTFSTVMRKPFQSVNGVGDKSSTGSVDADYIRA